MPYYKYSMLFAVSTVPKNGVGQTRVGGWSEGVYENTLNASYRAAFDNLCSARAALLPTTASIIGQRYQQVSPVGSAQTGSRVFQGASGLLTDSPQQTLLCRAAAQSGGNIRPVQIRCIPDDVISGGEFAPTPDYTAALTAYFDQLANWRFRGRELNAEQVAVINIEDDGTVFTEEATTFVNNDMVQILGAKQASTGRLVGGTFQVYGWVNAFNFRLRKWNHGEANNGRIRRRNFVFPLISRAGINISRVIQRKIGRPSNQFRGRKSRRRR